jgi:hypothetical protein
MKSLLLLLLLLPPPYVALQVEVSYMLPGTGAVISSSQVLQLLRATAPAAGQARDQLVAATAARFQVAEVRRIGIGQTSSE